MSSTHLLVLPLSALALAVPATASATDYFSRSVTAPASAGIDPAGLDGLRAVARATVVVRRDWRSLKPTAAGQLRFLTPGTSCRYVVTLRVRAVVGDAGDAAAYAERVLPTPGPQRLLDSGTRGTSAFRVVRPAAGDRVRVDALRAAVLTRRPDVAPQGKIVWSELSATALSRKGDECHAGTWRERIGPQLGDAMAVAKTRLAFRKVS